MKTKKVISLAACMVLACSATACGAPPMTQQQEEGKFNITIACQQEEGEIEVLEKLAEEYEKLNPSVNIIVKDFGGGSLDDYMTNNGRVKTLADIVWVPDDLFAPWAEKGNFFLDLREFYESSEETAYANYYESMLHSASYSGEYKPLSESTDAKYGLYYAPRDYNKIGIAYNTQLFQQFGIEVPTDFSAEAWNMETFIDFLQGVAEKIRSKGEAYALTYRAISFFMQWEPVYTTVFKEMGGDSLVKEDGTLNLDSEKNQEIMRKLYDELFSNEVIVGTEMDFKKGYTLMATCVRPVAYTAYMQRKGTVDFLPFPAKAIGAGCSGYAITREKANATQTVGGVTKKNKELCWDFIKYVITEEGQQVAGSFGTSVPILKSLEKNGAWKTAMGEDKNHAAWLAGEELRLTTYNRYATDVRTALRSNVSAILSDLQNKTSGAADKFANTLSTHTNEFNKKVR
ncbi:MAG: extracellular solute-binding protein [Clostridia bacterium]|nr:extracellular solute-binding protein [Clostridia bacterium]